jgi:hypothetical protein
MQYDTLNDQHQPLRSERFERLTRAKNQRQHGKDTASKQAAEQVQGVEVFELHNYLFHLVLVALTAAAIVAAASRVGVGNRVTVGDSQLVILLAPPALLGRQFT